MDSFLEKLQESHPRLKVDLGWNLPEGWFSLVSTLLEELNKLDGWDDRFVIQIKSKFGGLRFYLDFFADGTCPFDKINADKLIATAESNSFAICQTCAKESAFRGLCMECQPK